MMYLVFDTEHDALVANDIISTNMGLPKVNYNARTGEPEPDKQQTVMWAIPQQRLDEKWILTKPDEEFMSGVDATEEEYQDNWFPREDDIT